MIGQDPSQLPLRDIHLPASIGLWPPAVGWWVLALLGVGLPLAFWVVRAWQQRQRLRRAVLRDFAQLSASATTPHAFAAGLDVLLRRLALALEPAQPPGAGEAWLLQLQRLVPGLALDEELRRVLLRAPYDPQARFDLPRVRDALARALARLPNRQVSPRRV